MPAMPVEAIPEWWARRLACLPVDPWDVFTDFPRAGAAGDGHPPAPPQVQWVPVPLQDHSSSSDDKVEKVDQPDLTAAFAAVLGSLDHGREVVWLLDAAGPAPQPALPLRADLRGGTLQDLREQLLGERLSAMAALDPCGGAGLGGATLPGQPTDGGLELEDVELHEGGPGSAFAAVAQALASAPQDRFLAKRAHPICQAAVVRGLPIAPLKADFQPDFALCIGKVVKLAYRADLYEEATARMVARHLAILVDQRPSWSKIPIADAPAKMLDEEERRLVLHTWNDTEAAFEEALCVHQLFERCARGGAAQRVAILPAEPGAPAWTYHQLDIAAGEVAKALQSLPYGAGSRAALLMQRSANLVAAIYGILRAGYAYVPLDPEWPADRHLVIIDDITAAAVIVDEGTSAPDGSEHVAEVVVSGGLDPDSCPLVARVSRAPVAAADGGHGAAGLELHPRLPVYILYTSGTTGKPKGVEVPHYGLVGRTEWLQHTWPLGAADTVAQKTPATFAISEWEFFWPLCYGAKIALAAARMHGDSQHIAQLMLDKGVTHSVFVPSLLDQLLDELHGRPLPSLRLIIACGEALKASLVRACLAGLPGTELVNLYGPTEGTMTMLRFPREPSVKDLLRFPIGVPIENTQIICAHGPPPELEPAPALARGELVFGGPLIATGYWKLPELTREKFVDNPHLPGKAYRSGDIGRWRSDGTLEFLGRLDNQIKFNGVRIELGEIEAAAAGLPGVRAAVAFLSAPHLVLACTLVPADGAPTLAEAERLQVLAGLRRALPKDRVPTRVEVLQVMPTTDRGKVDRNRLLADFQLREAERAQKAKECAEAGSGEVEDGGLSQTEAAIEALMREVLGVDQRLSVTASFQDLGFSSLLLGKLTTRIRRACGLPALPATAAYRAPTARQLAAVVDEALLAEAAVAEGCGGGQLEEASAPRWRGLSSTSRLSATCTVAGLLIQSLVNEFAFLPAYYVLWAIWYAYGIPTMCILFAPVLLLDAFFALAVGVALKWCILGRRVEGDYPIFGWYYWKWWFVHEIEAFVAEHVNKTMADTPLYNVYLRWLGASVGTGVRINLVQMSDADLVTIGAGARIEREATICPARLRAGELQLRRVHIGEGAHVAHRAHLPGGSSLPANSRLSALASADPFGPHHVVPYHGVPAPSTTLTLLQLFVGLPIIFAVEGLACVPAMLAMEGLWAWLAAQAVEAGAGVATLSSAAAATGGQEGFSDFGAYDDDVYSPEGRRWVLYPFTVAIPWVWTFIHGGAYFLCVALVKWTVVGQFLPGPVRGDWDVFRRWLLERLTTTPTYDGFMHLWVNTEVLACWYRLLGARIASRVNMDVFGAVEFDLVEVEGDVVFGSGVLLVNTLDGVSQAMTIRRSACILDHSCVMPGAVVPEGTLLGSFTVVPRDQRLEAMTVYTGCEGGSCVRLFQRPLLPGEQIVGERVLRAPPDELGPLKKALPVASAAALKQRELEAKALSRHQSAAWLCLFNCWCVLSAGVFGPLPDVVYWATVLIDVEVYRLFKDSQWGEVVSVLLLAPIYIFVTMATMLLICALKWILIGRWTPGDRPYYTWFHFRWAALMTAFGSLHHLTSAVAGTWLAAVFMRLMGAEVGENVCFFGHGFEFDLLKIGDEVCIGQDCDVTAHTVENMVMKMEAVRFEEGASCMSGSLVMPGAQMEARSTLIEHSQVLKGETVPRGSCFGGLPAKLLRGYQWQPAAGEQVKERAQEASREMVSLVRVPDTRTDGELPLLESAGSASTAASRERTARYQQTRGSARGVGWARNWRAVGHVGEMDSRPGLDFFQIEAGEDDTPRRRCVVS